MSGHIPLDPHFDARVRESFARQQAMVHLGAELVTVEPGVCEIHLPYRAELTQQNGFLHAGILTTIADSAGGYAGFSMMPADHDVLAVEFKVNLLSPGKGDKLIARGEVLKSGKTLTITRVDGWMETAGQRTLCIVMQQTLMAMRPKA